MEKDTIKEFFELCIIFRIEPTSERLIRFKEHKEFKKLTDEAKILFM